MNSATTTDANADVATIVSDPAWFPLRYDGRSDEIHFAWLPREEHRKVATLAEESVFRNSRRQVVPRSALHGAGLDQAAQAPLHFILHSGLGGSTLLTRVLDQPGAAMTLSEPPILTDLMSKKLAGTAPADFPKIVADILRLMARPFEQGESVIVKCGAVANALGLEMLSARSDSQALCLYAPLNVFLASIARKGTFGRIWARQLFETLASARLTQLGIEQKDLFRLTDLQIGALGWLALHRELGRICQQAKGRVAESDSEELLRLAPKGAAAVAAHFGIALTASELADSPTLQAHSKTGEQFDSSLRRGEIEEALKVHGDEINMVVQWADKVAESQSIPIVLDAPTLSAN